MADLSIFDLQDLGARSIHLFYDLGWWAVSFEKTAITQVLNMKTMAWNIGLQRRKSDTNRILVSEGLSKRQIEDIVKVIATLEPETTLESAAFLVTTLLEGD